MTTDVTADPNWYGTLDADTETIVALADGYAEYKVLAVDGAEIAVYTADGTTPTVEGGGTSRILPTIAGYDDTVNVNSQATGNTIRLISSGTPQVAVQVIAGPDQG